MRRLSRRRFLQVAAASGFAVSAPWLDGCTSDDGSSLQPAPTPTPLPDPVYFFSTQEREIAERIAAALVPEGDGIAGASTTRAVEYIDRYLSAFDGPTAIIYRGGPYSGRWPFPDPDTGAPGDDFPHNDFGDALPLTRMQELAFRIELFGSDSVDNGDINAPLVEPWPGLRSLYRDTLQALGDLNVNPAELDDEEILALFGQTPSEFQTTLLRHVGEGMFGAPEYGGNVAGRGWSDYQYDGDSQPLGHTLFDADGAPRDRTDQPNQIEDPNRPAITFAPEVEEFIDLITLAQGGKRFF
jgi:hypothetical protein